jgi:hypothetical protein
MRYTGYKEINIGNKQAYPLSLWERAGVRVLVTPLSLVFPSS